MKLSELLLTPNGNKSVNFIDDVNPKLVPLYNRCFNKGGKLVKTNLITFLKMLLKDKSNHYLFDYSEAELKQLLVTPIAKIADSLIAMQKPTTIKYKSNHEIKAEIVAYVRANYPDGIEIDELDIIETEINENLGHNFSIIGDTLAEIIETDAIEKAKIFKEIGKYI